MKAKNISNKGQATLFRNRYLEFFTKTHPAVIFAMYVPVIGYMLWFSTARLGYPLWQTLLIYFGAIFFWTFFEYLAHRFLFHLVSHNKRLNRIAYVLHGNHHEYPRDKQRLFMPPVPSLLIAGTLFAIFYLIIGTRAFAFFPGFISGYLIYGSMHYAIHAFAPPFKWLKPLWRNHHLHHYKDEEKGFGVSSVLWDQVFGTMFPGKNGNVPDKTAKI